MRTEELIFTNAGLNLFKQALSQEVKVDFTTMKIGTGHKSTIEEYEALTALVSTYKSIGLSNLQMTETGLIKATSYFTNEDFESEVVITEVGLFGKLETGEEILVCYVNDGYGESFPPGNSGNILQKQRSFEFGIDRNTKVTAVVSSTMFATSKDLEEKVDKTRRISTGEGLTGGGDLTKDLDLKLLPATKNSLGGVIAGDNVEIDKTGKISVPGKYTHPAGNGNNHIPIGGRLKEFLKWTTAGLASWGRILASDIELTSTQRFVTDVEKANWNGKEPSFTKNSGHNKDFGFDKNEVMPGELFPAELGTDYAGILNVTGVKYVGKTYFCTATKKIYLCKIQNSLTYADLEKFVDISHKGLLDKLENLFSSGINKYGTWTKNHITGEIIQRGTVNLDPDRTTTVKLPISFSEVSYTIAMTARDNIANVSAVAQALPDSRDSFLTVSRYSQLSLNMQWIAIGY